MAAPLRRVVVAGGTGFFGGAVVELLRRRGLEPVGASRRTGLNLEDDASLRGFLRPQDVVVDAAGPFHLRSARMLEAAIDVGFDLIDLSDSLAYALSVLDHESRVAGAGIRVFTSCSSVSVVSSAALSWSGIERPSRVNGLLAPTSHRTSRQGTGAALLHGVGRRVRVWRDGALREAVGWIESRVVGGRRGHLFESADAVLLPHSWPSLRDVAMFVDTGVPGLNALLTLAARHPTILRLVQRGQGLGASLARLLGSRAGTLAYDVESEDGGNVLVSLVNSERAYLTAAAPAAMAAEAIARGRFKEVGLVPPDRQVDPGALRAYLRDLGTQVLTTHA